MEEKSADKTPLWVQDAPMSQIALSGRVFWENTAKGQICSHALC